MKGLAVKSFLGLINLLFFIGLFLFWPAGTFHWMQAWIYLAVFFSGVSVITIYIFLYDKNLLQSRLKVGSVAEKRIAQKIIQGIASIGFVGTYIIAGFDHRFQWSEMPSWLWIAGDALVAVTMFLLFFVFKKNSFLSATIEVQKNQQVVTDGPYAIVRHPMYAVALWLFVATPIALSSYWALFSLPLMVLILALRALDEENAMREELAGYKAYCNKVRYRLIPFIW